MRKVSRKTLAVTGGVLAALLTGQAAQAQQNTNLSGFNLPGVTLPQGHDEVRAADGTSCRSAVSGNGAYMDLGVISGPERLYNSSRGVYEDQGDRTSLYGRVVVPLNSPRKRVDCTRLYELEVERLRVELELLKMGIGRDPISTASTGGAAPASSDAQQAGQPAGDDPNWADEGWSNDGRKQK